jgi:hypothetical protein
LDNSPFLRKKNLVNMDFKFLLIFRAVEAFVKTTGIKAGELRFSGRNHGSSFTPDCYYPVPGWGAV